jgi:pyridoxal 5'-phosphate synthase pdxS subunit
MRALQSEMARLTTLGQEQLMAVAKDMGAPYDLVCYVAEHGELPVPNFSAGGIATPADAALVRQLGAQAVFVGSGIFKSDDPAARAVAIVKATTHFDDPAILLEVSRGLQPGMKGLEMSEIPEEERLASRGW